MMENKPQSMSTRDWLVSLTANKLGMEESLCDLILTWAYQKAKEATANNSSVELSGFGKIYVGDKKKERKLLSLKERLNNYRTEDTSYMSEEALKERENRVKEAQEYITYLESKTNENSLERSSGGMA